MKIFMKPRKNPTVAVLLAVLIIGSSAYIAAQEDTPPPRPIPNKEVSAGADKLKDPLIIDNFEGYGGSIFSKWQIRDYTKEEARKVYSIRRDDHNRFLRADSRGTSIQIARQVKWDIIKQQVLTWRWRVLAQPADASEDDSSRNDSAAGLYVVFPRKKIPLLPWDKQPINVIKYIWSTSLHRGRVLTKSKSALGMIVYEGRFIVIESGPEKLGRWIDERRNVFEDYKKYFGSEPEFDPILVSVLTDSNNTRDIAIADYDDITIWAIDRGEPEKDK
jgi:hypothetical protein